MRLFKFLRKFFFKPSFDIKIFRKKNLFEILKIVNKVGFSRFTVNEISFDLLKGELTLHLTDEEMTTRRAAWTAPKLSTNRGYLADFSATVSQADTGCVSKAYYPACK